MTHENVAISFIILTCDYCDTSGRIILTLTTKNLSFTGSILPPAKESSTTEIDLKLTTELFLGPQGDNVTELSKDNFDKIQEFLDSGKPEDTADGSTCQVVSSFSSDLILIQV